MTSFMIDEDAYLAHYGILRKSGRYPWNSGGDQETIYRDFISTVEAHKRAGWSESDISKYYNISTTDLRATKTIAKNAILAANIAQAQRLKDKANSNVAIGKLMGVNESVVRSWLAPGKKEKTDILTTTTNMLRNQVEEKKYIDFGQGVENQLGISKTRLTTAVAMLKEEGYNVYYLNVAQVGVKGQFTRTKVLAKKDLSWSEVYKNRDNIETISARSIDYGRTYTGNPLPPLSINKNRIAIVYGPEGGAKLDGVLFLRPGVEDISLGKSNYAQVRVLVGKDHYLKGMAIYKDDLPEGVDIQFNTNKTKKSNNITDVMKPISKLDPDNPFGAQISRQLTKPSRAGVEKVTSSMNIVNEEGDWFKWSRSLSSQVLSKQSPSLAKTQLDMNYEKKLQEFEEISKLTNPTVKKRLLNSFADDTDSSSVHLKAAALPSQSTSVILPIGSIPKGQIYAPNYQNGDSVVLIRYPHGGIFEIPELVVNNKNREARSILGNAKDAVGIHHTVAERLSGADFDGDTVLVIPNNSKKIQTSPALPGLKNFDPISAYPEYPGMKKTTPVRKQTLMGEVSNLITDMTIKGANPEELAAAVRHSMVVIDSEKHNLNQKQSYIDNGISNLKAKYQGSKRGGATTIISRASSPIDIPKRKARPASLGGAIDKVTGKKEFVNTNESYVNKSGKTIFKTQKSKRLAEEDDAFNLSSGSKIESIYATYSNDLKGLANKARKEAVNTQRALYSPSAAKVYSKEAQSLNAKLNVALMNSPLERRAQVVANGNIKKIIDANPDMDDTSLKKVKSIALNEARNRTGAKKIKIDITNDEWSAIQAGAISDTKLSNILNNADLDVVKQLATPRRTVLMSKVKTDRANAMLASGYTRAEVSKALGVSISTLDEVTIE